MGRSFCTFGFTKRTILCLLLILCTLSSLPSNKVQVSNAVESFVDDLYSYLPVIHPLFGENIRDISITQDLKGVYYLTGSVGDVEGIQKEIHVWKSTNMKDWQPIGKGGSVWNVDRDGRASIKEVAVRNGLRKCAVFSPEIFYFNETFWITYSISNSNSSGLLRSITGAAEGPYEDALPMVKGVNASLFRDANGAFWYLWGEGKIRKLNGSLSAFDGPVEDLKLPDGREKPDHVHLYFRGGTYFALSSYWSGAGVNHGYSMRTERELRVSPEGSYDCYVSSSSQLQGAFLEHQKPIPHAGGGSAFQDRRGMVWLTMSGNKDASAPFLYDPAVIPISISGDLFNVSLEYPVHPDESMPILYVSQKGGNGNGSSWKYAYVSLQDAVEASKPGTQIWVAQGIYSAPLEIVQKKGIYIYGGFDGTEKSLSMRDPGKNKVVIDGKQKNSHAVFLSNSQYVRIDGFTIRGGKSNGRNFHDQYGAGIYVLGGGENVRIVNCEVKENYAEKDGAGIYCSMGASPLLINCEICDNKAGRNGGGIAFYGNAANGYHLQLYNCIISDNEAVQDGGALFFDTDLKYTGLLRMNNCVVSGNITNFEQGAIDLESTTSLFVSNSTFVGNIGEESGASVFSFGAPPSHARIENSIFADNVGGTLLQGYGERMIWSNDVEEKWLYLRNCLFFKNKSEAIYTRITDHYKIRNIKDLNVLPIGHQNIEGDPMFVDTQKSDFRLLQNSTAIDAGSSQCAFPVDMAGKKRSISSAEEKGLIDVGAFER